MSSKTRSIFKIISILTVVVLLLTELGIVIIPAIIAYKFWLMVIAYFLLFISAK